jgi:predicted porin
LVLQNGLPISRQGTSADGNRDGQAINGSAYVGVSSARYGTLTIGRQNTFQLEGISNYDPMGAAFAFSLIGIVGATAGAGATEETRWDNSIKYLYEYGPLHFGAMYQAPGTIGGAGNDFGYAFDVGGNFAGLSVDSIYTEKHDATLSAPLTAAQVATDPLNSLAVKVADTTAYTLLAKYNLERFTFYVGTSYMILADPANSLAAGDTLTGGYDIGTVVNNAFLHHRDLVSSWGGIKYALTDRLDVTGAFYDFTSNAFGTGALAGCTASVIAPQCSGKFFTTAGLLDYRLSKRFDAFFGAAYSQVTGGFRFGALHNNTVDPTIGGRFTF